MVTLRENRMDHAGIGARPVGNQSRSVVDLFRELRDEMMMLFRQEATLLRTEMTTKAQRLTRNLAYLGIGAGVAFAALLILLGAASRGLDAALLAAGLDSTVSYWLAPLIVGVVAAIVGGIMVAKALNTLKTESAAPERTMESLRENTQWIKDKARQEKVTP